ncbi:hypothetical protein [Lysobacter sp. Root494]|uniref:hypothetical protein n=1 Tax=Lysobacter sp. Root494 TaxID=1736549 RepID=UPI0006F918D2|nr:hypothetical protein [Lysobacter sp. Root494]KQY51743.1 hypothetical protein ASD14_03365 [Lysobacter sp. Root494]
MKRLKISLISLLGAVAFTAMVQAAEPQATPASDTTAAARADANKPPASDAYCLRHTGTRITSRAADKVDASASTASARKSRTCSNGAIGRAYTRDDLDRTGDINLADALRKLDPAIH